MESGDFLSRVVELWKNGGVWMYPILFCFAVSVGIVLERTIRLFFQFNTDGPAFMFEVQKHVLANDLDGAIRLCNGSGNAVLPKVLKAGLQRASRDENQIQNALDAASLEAIPKLERRIPYLAAVANIATLLGLLGTISGLIASFKSLEKADPAQKQALLSAGISEAMSATAFGLVTAILAMSAHSLLAARAAKITEEIDEFGVKLMDLLSARKYRHSSEKGSHD